MYSWIGTHLFGCLIEQVCWQIGWIGGLSQFLMKKMVGCQVFFCIILFLGGGGCGTVRDPRRVGSGQGGSMASMARPALFFFQSCHTSSSWFIGVSQEDGRAAKNLESTQVLLGEANSEMDNLS
ncbi:hypothetical protein CROQUDRAFT_282796 [Cronartium quercuum f. sp. fusiforme G11]|uniref:Uncharacterized protein n=1 Tax=Cronartium quercuum f. sp. fusiforme G11 TaxID=708437 RepID=A0A9P6ND84_9BASI|nr:hypothetical protein CROQUDRAFT_282796 [Cronartium quercuum f. sp. fusiforme G11]